MKKIEIRDSVFEQVKALKSGTWTELCDNDVFFSEVVENLLMELVVHQKAYERVENLKEEFENKIGDYIKGDIPEWREKKGKKQ